MLSQDCFCFLRQYFSLSDASFPLSNSVHHLKWHIAAASISIHSSVIFLHLISYSGHDYDFTLSPIHNTRTRSIQTTCGQSNNSTSVNYDSRVVITRKLLIFMTLDSSIKIIHRVFIRMVTVYSYDLTNGSFWRGLF